MSKTGQKREGRRYFGDLPKWSRLLIIIASVGLIVGVSIEAVWEVHLNNYSYENWERTTGTVVYVQMIHRRIGPYGAERRSDRLTVEIEVNGEVFSSRNFEANLGSFRRGAEIAVRYDPGNPNAMVRDWPPRPIIDAFMIPGILTAVIFLALISNFRIIPPRKRTFSLETNLRKYLNEELNVQLFEEIISRPDLWDFMVLEPDRPIKDSIFIQASYPQATSWPPEFILEISFSNKKTGTKLYRLATVDKNIVLKHIIDYWQKQEIPDVSLWEDVSYIL
ncbi:MAG: DUF3592 domain-containing protein [Defluviitaleaceae bacterium]|nr:DUF3592 domain-containing protein [Defluviitaleaceae bacterium]